MGFRCAAQRRRLCSAATAWRYCSAHHHRCHRRPRRSLEQRAAGQYPWDYFAARMAVRWEVRRALCTLASFLRARSAATLLPLPPLGNVAAAESALRWRLPWQVYELYRREQGMVGREQREGGRKGMLAGPWDLQVW